MCVFKQSGKRSDVLPDQVNLFDMEQRLASLKLKSSYNVFTDMKSVHANLTDAKFKLVDSQEQADFIFVRASFKDYK